jgi:hypothetical protein
MADIIHFRSRYGHLDRSWSADPEKKNRSPEWGNIRIATPDEDVRDIVWGRSTWWDIYARDRYTHTGIHIWVIFSDISDREKSLYSKNIRDIIQSSASFARYPYSEDMIWTMRNHLIFIIISSIEEVDYREYYQLSQTNDLIFVSILHPLERNPGDTMFESKIITPSYIKAFLARLDQIKYYVIKSRASIIFLDTTEDPVLAINHFFKHRYG